MNIFDKYDIESFQMEMEAPDGGTDLTEEDVEEVIIFRCPICDDQHGNRNIQICEYHQAEFLN